MWWPALGAVVVGIGGIIEPRVLGAGYNSIQDLLDGSLALKAMLLLLAVKAVVWLVALGSGTSGGILAPLLRSEEHTSELQSLMRISYAVFCLKKKNTTRKTHIHTQKQHNHVTYRPQQNI